MGVLFTVNRMFENPTCPLSGVHVPFCVFFQRNVAQCNRRARMHVVMVKRIFQGGWTIQMLFSIGDEKAFASRESLKARQVGFLVAFGTQRHSGEGSVEAKF